MNKKFIVGFYLFALLYIKNALFICFVYIERIYLCILKQIDMSNLKNQFDEEVKTFNEEYAKFTEKGNNSAGTRARKALQSLRVIAFDIRKEITEAKNK